MKLTKFSFQHTNWRIEGLEFSQLNLIIGKNASGKSTTLYTIALFVDILCQNRVGLLSGNFCATFENNNGNKIELSFTLQLKGLDGIVRSETITVDGKNVLFRSEDKETLIMNMVSGEMEAINPPLSKLTIHTIRDVKKYPFLEDISYWAEHTHGFKFGNVRPIDLPFHREHEMMSTLTDIPTIYYNLPESEKDTVLKEMSSAGYNLNRIWVEANRNPKEDILYVNEEGVGEPIPHFALSQGMYRALTLIIWLVYLQNRRTQMMIIDDLGEGLDYERAKKFGRRVFEFCSQNEIQLIATSNDSFLMDEVDLDYWTILQRTGSNVSALNIKNSPKLFEEFRFTGLSNFDFFSSDYILQHQK